MAPMVELTDEPEEDEITVREVTQDAPVAIAWVRKEDGTDVHYGPHCRDVLRAHIALAAKEILGHTNFTLRGTGELGSPDMRVLHGDDAELKVRVDTFRGLFLFPVGERLFVVGPEVTPFVDATEVGWWPREEKVWWKTPPGWAF